jgi:uncharacterized protein Yka (UPF0111/DUF47 family)
MFTTNIPMASKLLKLFIPKNQLFFDLFNQSSANNLEMSNLLYKIVSGDNKADSTKQLYGIDRLKQTGNELKHKVYLASAKAFVSPFERNDMYALASAINHICDYIHISSRRFSLYQGDMAAPAIKELSGIIIETSSELDNAVKGLDNLGNAKSIIQSCNKVKELEDYADRVYSKAVGSIMSAEGDSIEQIKFTEILAALERTTDKCEDATDVIESIIIKNQ